jgi:hypothetical protein
MPNDSICFGVNIYPASREAAGRQDKANRSLRALHGVELINLQFRNKQTLQTRKGFDTLCVLEKDSTTVTGRPGACKPIVSEIFDVLAKEAFKRGCRYFAFANSDIEVTQRAVDFIFDSDSECYVFSRMDYDRVSGQDLRISIWGVDCFVIDASWWIKNRRRFRGFILGEMAWDNTYASILMCHSQCLLLNRDPLIRHEHHAIGWTESPFAAFNGYLAALDARYFSLWCGYIKRLEALRNGCTLGEDELQLQKHAFQWSSTPGQRLKHVARSCRAHWRHYCYRTGLKKYA